MSINANSKLSNASNILCTPSSAKVLRENSLIILCDNLDAKSSRVIAEFKDLILKILFIILKILLILSY